jgi:hypothetical protein
MTSGLTFSDNNNNNNSGLQAGITNSPVQA